MGDSKLHQFRLARTLALVSAICALANAICAAGAPPVSEPQAVTNKFWGKLLVPCGGSYFYGGSFFDRQGMLSTLGAGNNPSVIEFRGVKFDTVPEQISDAERLNGLQYRARISMIAHVYREDGGQWMDGPELQPRNIDDVMGKALQSIVADAGQLGDGGAIVFDLVKSKGHWYVSRSSASMSGPLIGSPGYYGIDQVIAATPAETCSTLGYRLKQTQTAEAADIAKKQHDDAVAAAWAKPGPVHDPVKGIPYLLLTDDEYAQLLHWYGPTPYSEKGGDPELFKAEAIVNRYPILPNANQWLPVGTTFERDSDMPQLDPQNGRQKMLMVVKITAGPQSGRKAIIESANYGSSDIKLPGRVWRTAEDQRAAEAVLEAQHQRFMAEERKIIRDPVKGIPFGPISNEDFDELMATYQNSMLGSEKTDGLTRTLATAFDPHSNNWLAPGTTYASVVTDPDKPYTHISFGNADYTKTFIIVRITSGPHDGEYVFIEQGNYSSNAQIVCDPDYEQLRCDKS